MFMNEMSMSFAEMKNIRIEVEKKMKNLKLHHQFASSLKQELFAKRDTLNVVQIHGFRTLIAKHYILADEILEELKVLNDLLKGWEAHEE